MGKQDNSQNYAMEHLTRTAIETLPPNAIVLCSGDLQVRGRLSSRS